MRVPFVLPALLALLPLGATSARADSNDELWIGGATRALRSTSANALTDRNLGGSSLGYARDLGITTLPGVALWAAGGATAQVAEGTMFQTMSTRIDALGFTAGLRARYSLHRLITASARLDLGAQRVGLDLADGFGGASDQAWGTMASAGTALDLFAVARPGMGLGVRLEIGYVVAQDISLTPHRGSPEDVLELPMRDLAIGGLDLSGPTFTAALVAQF